ncbi:MAG: hypothetical protein IT474_04215 [Arenimonas sp.]|nr:hypothetical protein [Arenimonas sp.]
MKRCPKCKIFSEDGVDLCDCGYRYSTNKIETPATKANSANKNDNNEKISGIWNIHHVILAFFMASGAYQITQATPGASSSRFIAFAVFWIFGYTVSKMLIKKLIKFNFAKFSPFIFGTALAIAYLFLGLVFLAFSWALNLTTNN